jgi:uncharacterized protein YndB with AHSA1/START domain
MKEFHGQANIRIDADPTSVFELITDIDRLPDWNRAIETVVERPDHLTEGAQWTVRMHPPRSPRWGSVSRVELLDRNDRTFVYQTRNTDGNPSHVRWAWHAAEDGDGTTVDVTWDCYLKTLDRRVLAGPIRKRGLAREVPGSLAALATAARSAGAPTDL